MRSWLRVNAINAGDCLPLQSSWLLGAVHCTKSNAMPSFLVAARCGSLQARITRATYQKLDLVRLIYPWKSWTSWDCEQLEPFSGASAVPGCLF